MKSILLTSTILLSLAGAPALAQESSEQAAADAQSGGIEDIVVTAQRRSESVQKTSVSISVLSADQLAQAGVTQARDLANSVPGVQIGQGGAATQIYIRGIGDFGSTSSSNPAVAFNVDGVYVARPAAIEGNFFDIERVEVLKGPQGTLYGRNSVGGAINVLPAKPKLGVREMSGAIEIGNYSKFGADAAFNLPLGDTVAIRVAGQVVSRDGYLSQGYDDDVHQSIRGQVLFAPNDRFSVRVAGDYIHVGGQGANQVPLNKIPGVNDRWTSLNDPRVAAFYDQQAVGLGLCAPIGPQFPTSPGNITTYRGGACPNLVIPGGPIAGTYPQAQLARSFADDGFRTNNVFWSVYGELEYDLDFAKLTVLPAYRSTSLDYGVFPGGSVKFDISADDVPETSKATSVEARLSRDTGALKGVIGLYYFNEDQKGQFTVNGGFLQRAIFYTDANTRSYAAFGQASLSISDSFRLLGGLRYTSDRREIDSPVYGLIGGQQVLGPLAAGCIPSQVPNSTDPTFVGCLVERPAGKVKFNRLNWKAGVEFDLGPSNMLYATASTGYKAGGLYQGFATTTEAGSYDPEDLKAFEIGSRNRFLNNMLQVNLDGFYYDYKNHQEPVIQVDALGVIVQSIQNAGKGRAFGGSADIVAKLSQNDTFHFGVEYLNTKYTSFVYNAPIVAGRRFVAPNGTGCLLSENAAQTQQTIDCSGKPLTRSPKWSGLASYSHVFEFDNGGNLEAKGEMNFQSSRFLGPEYLTISKAQAYAVFNASLTYSSSASNWTLTAYVRNIGNEAVFLSSQQANFVPGYVTATIAPPRTFGARLGFKF